MLNENNTLSIFELRLVVIFAKTIFCENGKEQTCNAFPEMGWREKTTYSRN